jgi:hypothetical protein
MSGSLIVWILLREIARSRIFILRPSNGCFLLISLEKPFAAVARGFLVFRWSTYLSLREPFDYKFAK